MAGGRWHLIDLYNAYYSSSFHIAGHTDTHVIIDRLYETGGRQRMHMLKLAPHIKLFIVLMSEPGAGKSSVAQLLAQKGAYFVSSHSRVSNALKLLEIDESEERDALQGLGSYLGANYPVVWINKIISEFNSQKSEVVVWDGGRFPHDVKLPKLAYGEKVKSILVAADPGLRAVRTIGRAREGDPAAHEEFLRQDANDDKVFMFKITKGLSDYTIYNNGTEPELLVKVDALWAQLKEEYELS